MTLTPQGSLPHDVADTIAASPGVAALYDSATVIVTTARSGAQRQLPAATVT